MTSVPHSINANNKADTEPGKRCTNQQGAGISSNDVDVSVAPRQTGPTAAGIDLRTAGLSARAPSGSASPPVDQATVANYLRIHWTAESPKWLSVPQQPVRRLQQQRRALLSALNTLPFGVCIVQADLTVLESNREARRILALNNGLRKDSTNRLTSINHAALAQAVHQACFTTGDQRDAQRTSLLIDRSVGQHPISIDVMPLRDTSVETVDQFCGAMIAIIDPSIPPPLSTSRISQIYKLSAAEAAICQHIVDGWSNRQIATARHVSIDTIKTQIRSLMHKTSTSHRADLIRLAAQLAPALFPRDPP